MSVLPCSCAPGGSAMDEYDRLRQIGRGAFGEVHLCRRRRDRRLVVHKYIQMPEADTKQAMNEVSVLRLLSHPNIIEYLSSHVQERALVIVMEYAPGGTLRDYLLSRQELPLDEAEALGLFAQMALAVQHIHALSILHRDLKSENMLLDRERRVLKVGDFGISKLLETKTSASTVVGTPCYLSPELCEGRPYHRSTDVWALGCLLYELVTLRRTFEAATLAALVLKILRGSYAPLPGHLSAGLRRLVSAMLSLDPARRPAVTQVVAHPVLAAHCCRLYTDLGMVPWRAAARPLSLSASQTLPGAVWAAGRVQPPPPPPPPPGDSLWLLTPELALRELALPAGERLAAAARGPGALVGVTSAGLALLWWLPAGQATPLPVERPDGVKFAAAACGGATVALLTRRGVVLTAEAGPAGLAAPLRVLQPLLGHEVTQLSGGADHLLARTAAGAVFAWGAGSEGQLGSGGRRAASAPQSLPLPAGATAARVRAGAGCSLIVTTDGKLLTCGLNAAGRLGAAPGDGKPGERRLRPAAVTLPEPVSDAAACPARSALLAGSGALLWLGGQAGAAPVRCPLPAAVTALSGGAGAAVLVLCEDGAVFAVSESGTKQPVRLQLPGPGRPRLGDGAVLMMVAQ